MKYRQQKMKQEITVVKLLQEIAGTENRKQYSVTGNTVILAARLEQLNKEFNTSLIVSKDVIDNIKIEDVEFISLGYVK